MDQMLSAVYEHGSLRLLEPVDLAESSPVQVQILAPEGDFRISAFRRLLVSIQHLLDTVEDAWDDNLVRETFPPIFRADLRTLWQLSREPQRELCALLQLAAARLQPYHLTRTQITAIRATLDHLAQPSLTETEILACHNRLIASGLPPAFSLDAEAMQSYVDELPDPIVCDLVAAGVKLHANQRFTVADACRKEHAACHLPDFLAAHQAELRAIVEYLTGHPQIVKEQPKPERLLHTVITDPRAALGQSACWPLGDVIIALQALPDARVWTIDADFAPLLHALGLMRYAPTLM